MYATAQDVAVLSESIGRLGSIKNLVGDADDLELDVQVERQPVKVF